MPIPLEVLKRVTVVYTHKSCPDGMASAMVLKDAFRMLGTSPRIKFLAHGTPEHIDAGFDEPSLFCDFAPHPERASRLARGAITTVAAGMRRRPVSRWQRGSARSAAAR